jgi:hypothetical protein
MGHEDSLLLELTCSPCLRWVKDSDQILVVDERINTPTVLQGVEAAVWDWLMLGYNLPDVSELLAVLCNESQVLAETRLFGLLQGWLKSGWLNWQENKEHG